MSDDWVHTEGSYREGYDAGRAEVERLRAASPVYVPWEWSTEDDESVALWRSLDADAQQAICAVGVQGHAAFADHGPESGREHECMMGRIVAAVRRAISAQLTSPTDKGVRALLHPRFWDAVTASWNHTEEQR